MANTFNIDSFVSFDAGFLIVSLDGIFYYLHYSKNEVFH